MLTGTQVATGAYVTEDGTLLCVDCYESGGEYARPVSNYELDELQTAYGGYGSDYVCVQAEDDSRYWADALEVEGTDLEYFSDECEQALYDENGHELREEYHYHHKGEYPNRSEVPSGE